MSDNFKDSKKDSIKTGQNTLIMLGDLGNVSINKHHSFLTKKIERLTSALYVITGFLPAAEPVRNRLRECALDLIKQASHPAGLTEGGVETFRAGCSEIGVLLQMARSANLISGMNADLLAREYDSLASFVRDFSDSIREKGDQEKIENHIGQDIEKPDMSFMKIASTVTTKKYANKSKTDKKGKDSRRKMILDLIDKKDKISINEAVSVIPGVSEKTVQRELMSLVQDGLVIKEGERRWSTYRKVALAA